MTWMRNTGAVRLALGLGQGLVLFLLYKSVGQKVWPATQPYAFEPLSALALFLPLVANVSWGNVPVRVLVKWLAVLAGVITALGLFVAYKYGTPVLLDARGELQPGSAALKAWLAVGIFIGHTLLVAAQTDGKPFASYRSYFDFAWKHGVQVVAAFMFTLAFWALLFLSAALFKLIKLEFVEQLIRHDWFAIPATALVVSAALHITDVRPGIVAGVRTLALTLLSWLLPLMAVIVTVFIASIPFAGFDLLWETRFATASLLVTSAVLIILINAAYQDGAQETLPKILRGASMLAAMILTPLVLIAGYGLALRVTQYGWTADRIVAAACVVVAVGYAGSYLWAVGRTALRQQPWLVDIERANVVMSFVVIAVVTVLFTPLADPARISVASQMARLKEGRIAPEEFDLAYLRFNAGRYGRDALAELAADAGKGEAFQKRAVAALNARYGTDIAGQPVPSATSLAQDITVTPGKTLPQSFLDQDWAAYSGNRSLLPDCLRKHGARCEALMADLNHDGIDEVILHRSRPLQTGTVFQFTPGTGWNLIGHMPPSMTNCPSTATALANEGATPVTALWDDLMIGGQRFSVQPNPPECPES